MIRGGPTDQYDNSRPVHGMWVLPEIPLDENTVSRDLEIAGSEIVTPSSAGYAGLETLQ
jgi:hypothetical protein